MDEIEVADDERYVVYYSVDDGSDAILRRTSSTVNCTSGSACFISATYLAKYRCADPYSFRRSASSPRRRSDGPRTNNSSCGQLCATLICAPFHRPISPNVLKRQYVARPKKRHGLGVLRDSISCNLNLSAGCLPRLFFC